MKCKNRPAKKTLLDLIPEKAFIVGFYVGMAIIAILLILVILESCRVQASPVEKQVTLTWTAPGDDGNIGQAGAYDIRYNTVPINAATWETSTQVENEPTPKLAMSSESFSFGLMIEYDVTYYFAIKTVDDAGNWSGLSNIATRIWHDDMPPVAILDLIAN